MKRRYLLCALGLALLLFGGCANQQAQMTYIGAEKAKQLALDAAGLTAAGVESITTDLNTRDGLDYYQVELTAAGHSYQYDVDALTGVIIETRIPDAENTVLPDGADAYNSGQPVQTTPESQPPASDQPTGSGNNTAANTITTDQAKEIALAHAGLTSGQATFTKSRLEYEKGRQVYELEFYAVNSGDGAAREYEYEIDAGTGEVIRFDYDVKGALSAASGSAITAEKAKELALAQVPGATADNIREFKTDHDDGRIEYEGKIIYNGMEYEFEIDGYSGAIRSWEAEPAGH